MRVSSWKVPAAVVAFGLVATVSLPGVASAGGGVTLLPGLPPLPPPPQLSQLPGAGGFPDLSTIPGTGALPGGGEVPGLTNSAAPPVTDPSVGGAFGPLFAPPGPACPNETQGSAPTEPTLASTVCKPAAVNMSLLPDGRVVYWDGLEGEENVNYTIVLEVGDAARNDQSRVLSLDYSNPSGSSFLTPANPTGGATGAGEGQYLVPNAPGLLSGILNDQNAAGAGALFCSDQVTLFNGEQLVPGGTDWYSEPRLPGTPFGLAELQGLKDTRIFDPTTDTWSVTNPMNRGRWYPSLVTLGNGEVFVASGVTKLVKPVYPQNPLMSGTNVEQTETFNPLTAQWTENPSSANRALPLYPRLHLLPDGHVYYDAGGEVFNPFGQAYDEALWNVAGSYDPSTQTWTNLGAPLGLSLDPSRGLAGVAPTAGFRGSSFSVMLPLAPNGSGQYDQASFLSAGGVLGTTPGAYFATTSSAVDTVRTAGGGESFTSSATGPLVNARWFSTAVVLPTGQVAAFNGTNRDDVLGPGTSFPVTQAEMFDPTSKTWSPLVSTSDPRGYHNTAMLLPSGQILLGGSAPIAALDLYTQTLPGGFIDNWRDPSFQLYDPPYLHWGYAQPQITSLDSGSPAQPIGYGSTFHVGFHLGTPGNSVAKVVLVRDPNVTHVVDGDQRNVELPFTVNPDDTVTVTAPPGGNVAPPGDYMLFVDEKTPKGLVPSVAAQLWVGGSPDVVPAGLPSGQVVGHLASVGGGNATGVLTGSVVGPSSAGVTGTSGLATDTGTLGQVAGVTAVAPAAGF